MSMCSSSVRAGMTMMPPPKPRRAPRRPAMMEMANVIPVKVRGVTGGGYRGLDGLDQSNAHPSPHPLPQGEREQIKWPGGTALRAVPPLAKEEIIAPLYYIELLSEFQR